jgi:hypothetical protein
MGLKSKSGFRIAVISKLNIGKILVIDRFLMNTQKIER